MSEDLLTGFSPAKINLFLEIVSRRKDNFHNLNSLMCFCNIGDLITIRKNRSYKLEITGPFSKQLNSYKDNLITFTINEISKLLDRKFNLHVNLQKNLPIGSGLGGGSSNAATILRLIIKLYNLDLNSNKLNRLLIKLGSDVPFCFYSKTALLTEKGQKLISVPPLPNFYILIVNPLIHVSTKEIFLKVKTFSSNLTTINKNVKKRDYINLIKKAKNDLEILASERYPEIGKILKIFRSNTKSLISRMSGSGASCFGIYKNKDDLKIAQNVFMDFNEDWWVKSGKILNYL